MQTYLKKLLSAILIVSFIVTPSVHADRYSDANINIYNKDAKLSACATTETGEPGGTDETGGGGEVPVNFSLGTDPKQRRIALMQALIDDYGLKPEQAAGPVGNFMKEAANAVSVAKKLPPDVNQKELTGAPPNMSNGLGYGWAQWSDSRKTDFVQFANQHGYMRDGRATDAADYAFLKHELNTSYKSTITQLKLQTSPEKAAESFEDTYESAGKPVLTERMQFARDAFNEYRGIDDSTTPTPGATDPTGCAPEGGGTAILGDKAFPLKGSKNVVKNRNIFKNNTTDVAGHPYTAYDILADPGTEIVAFMGGYVTHFGTDKCGGTLISIWNQKANIVVSYLHTNVGGANDVEEGDTVTAGQHVATVGSDSYGCGTPHLHIDAARGKVRPGCKREECPAANQAKFVDIGPDLYATYQLLPGAD